MPAPIDSCRVPLPGSSKAIAKPVVPSNTNLTDETTDLETTASKKFQDHWKDNDPTRPVHDYQPYNCRRKIQGDPQPVQTTEITVPSKEDHLARVALFWETLLGPKPGTCQHPMAG